MVNWSSQTVKESVAVELQGHLPMASLEVHLSDRERKERGRQVRDSVPWFIPQMPTIARAEGGNQELILGGTQVTRSKPLPPQVSTLSGTRVGN